MATQTRITVSTNTSPPLRPTHINEQNSQTQIPTSENKVTERDGKVSEYKKFIRHEDSLLFAQRLAKIETFDHNFLIFSQIIMCTNNSY